MVFIVRKKIRGKIYLYLTKKGRVDGKVKTIWQKYLGPEDDLEKLSQTIDAAKKNYEPSVRNFGLPVILMKIAKRLSLVDIIDQQVSKRNQGLSVGEYLLISAINRCVKPKSKAQMKKWFDTTYLKNIFPKIDTYLDSNAYTNHYEYLNDENIGRIELELQKMLISEFSLSMDNLFYDPTNYYTFINPRNQELPRHGKSKEGRNTLNLISLSLFCTQDGGIPIMHQTYPGNIHDATHFKSEFPRFIERMLSIGVDTSNLTLVFDKGNLSEEVFSEIENSKINFICSVRPSTQKNLHSLKGEDFEIFTLPNGKKVGLKEFSGKLYDNRYSLIVSYNPSKNAWSRGIKLSKIEKKVYEVQKFFENRLNIKKWREKENVEKKILSIIKNKDYFNYIGYNVKGDYGKLKFSIKIKRKTLDEHLDTLGKSYYMTNRSDLSAKEILWLYRQQYTIENAFRYIKMPNHIQIRPMYHHKDSSIRGHVFSIVLGLLLLTLLHREIRLEFPKLSLMETIEYLSEIQLVSVNVSSGRTIHTIAKMSPEAEKLSKFFGLNQYL